jgi:hypothetical protein
MFGGKVKRREVSSESAKLVLLQALAMQQERYLWIP